MKAILTFTNGGQSYEFDSIQDAVKEIHNRYLHPAVYDAGGFEVDDHITDNRYDIRNGRAALVWESEEDSINDDGARAIASIDVIEEKKLRFEGAQPN